MIVNVALIIQNIHQKNKLKNMQIFNSNALVVREVPEFFLFAVNEDDYSSFEILNSPNYKIFIFFQVYDCASCKLSGDFLEYISKKKNLDVYGIVNHPYKEELIKWIKNENLPFPVLMDLNEKVTKSFGIYETPTIVLADNMNRIIFSSKLTKNSRNTLLLNYIDEYLDIR